MVIIIQVNIRRPLRIILEYNLNWTYFNFKYLIFFSTFYYDKKIFNTFSNYGCIKTRQVELLLFFFIEI